MPEKELAPDGIDAEIPNGARIYDYLLGGRENYPADRAAGDRMVQANPAAGRTAQANREFLGRAVAHLAGEAGLTQFLDLGSGLPTQRNVHQVAQEVSPEARVVYVDHDPGVIRHSQALLERDKVRNVVAVRGDLRELGGILDDPGIAHFLDFTQPVAVLMVAVLHFVSDEEGAHGLVRQLAGVLAPGSHIVISHTADESPPEVRAAASQGFRLAGATLTPRSRAEITRFFTGFELLEPGVVEVGAWRPRGPGEPAEASAPGAWTIVGGVGVLREPPG